MYNNYTLFKIIEGNGTAGMKGRLTELEGTVGRQEARWKWIFGIIAALIVALIISHATGKMG